MYALCDCNNLFASCERVFNPSLNGKPVVVLSNNDGCIIGLRTWKELHCEHCIEFEHLTPDKQYITVSRSFVKELNDFESLQEIMYTFVAMAAGKLRNSLRYIALTSAHIPSIDLSASTGIWSGKEVIKVLLAGATTAQVCSVLYEQGVDQLGVMLKYIEDWMVKNGFENIGDFRASMNLKNVSDPIIYERSQFMKYFSSVE